MEIHGWRLVGECWWEHTFPVTHPGAKQSVVKTVSLDRIFATGDVRLQAAAASAGMGSIMGQGEFA